MWRLISVDKGSVVFSVNNDIFQHKSANYSPFVKEDFEFNCNIKCEEFGYNDFPSSGKKTTVYCCNTDAVLKNSKYNHLLKDKMSVKTKTVLRADMLEKSVPKSVESNRFSISRYS